MFDIVYLGCSQLVENYKDEARLKQWCEIFKGILQGYNGLLPLSKDKINAIPPLFVFDEILLTAFYLKNGEPHIAKSREEMTNWLHDNIAALIDYNRKSEVDRSINMRTNISELLFSTRDDFRAWLRDNSETSEGVWLVSGKTKAIV